MSAGAPDRGPKPPPGRAAIAARLRERLGPAPERTEWPPISVVVVSRDGEGHLRQLLPRLADATDYPCLELVLVDNASGDGSVGFARSAELSFPVRVIENSENIAYSDANDDGAEVARHDRLLFLNNDVEPFEPGWLKELVACLEDGGAAAAGATLLHAGLGSPAGVYGVQHRRVELAGAAGFVAPVNAGDGEELREPGADVEAVASTAACLLVRRDAFERVGGFSTGFRWGWEDVDLGLKLVSGGDPVVCSGRSLLFHRESSTRARESNDWQRSTRAHNRRLFAARWGPQVRREYVLDRLAGGGLWTDGRPPLLAVVLSGREDADAEARELADAVEAEGWRVALVGDRDELPAEADFTLVTDLAFGVSLPPGAACVAWVRERASSWADAPLLRRAELTLVADLGLAPALEAAGVTAELFAGPADAGRLRRLLSERAQRLRFCIKLSGEWELEPAALSLRRSLEARGHACSLQLADEWDLLGGMTADVNVVCGDPADYLGNPAQLNVHWAREEISPTECDRWDLVLVAGEEDARALAAETPTPVVALDLGSTADAAGPLLDHVALANDRSGVPTRVLAHA